MGFCHQCYSKIVLVYQIKKLMKAPLNIPKE